MVKRDFSTFLRQGGGAVSPPRKTRLRISQSKPGARYTEDEVARIHDIVHEVTRGSYPTADQLSAIVDHLHRILPNRSKTALRDKIRSLLREEKARIDITVRRTIRRSYPTPKEMQTIVEQLHRTLGLPKTLLKDKIQAYFDTDLVQEFDRLRIE